MSENKYIDRTSQEATTIFDNRSLDVDYRTLIPLLKEGMTVLDVGCGTGAISAGIANAIGESGKVIGIDNTANFIESGNETYSNVKNLELIHTDLYLYEPEQKFDLIIAARALQWFNDPKAGMIKMKSMLNPNGQISILDYDHVNIEWEPAIPASMQTFYNAFLHWRNDSGMNNAVIDVLPEFFEDLGFTNVEVINANEFYDRTREDFDAKVGVWSMVAKSDQMVKDGYLDDEIRLKAIVEYDDWLEEAAVSMTMKLKDVRATLPVE